VSNRAYQEISGDISWSAVNGYYGLAKDAYPGLNPRSSGDKAVRTWTGRTTEVNSWNAICWSPRLGIFVAVAYGGSKRAMTSPDGITWTARTVELGEWVDVCWSQEVGLFVAVAPGAITSVNRVMTSPDGATWTPRAVETSGWYGVCWSAEVGLFVAVALSGTYNIMTSINGTSWNRAIAPQANEWRKVCWSPELKLFVAVASTGNNRVMTSTNGIDWVLITLPITLETGTWSGICWSGKLGLFVSLAGALAMTSNNGINWNKITVEGNVGALVCWSPELGIFVGVGYTSGGAMNLTTSRDGITWNSSTISTIYLTGVCWSPELGIFVIISQDATNRVLTSSLKGRPPTSYNVFDSSFNSIDEYGKWTFLNIAISGTMTAGTTDVKSDDRLKHNEVVITNGLTIIDQLTPKFYQKTFTMLDASYNGDLSGYAWIYEAGLIAQEVLQVPDLSFAVGGGDYYQETYILRDQSNDISANYYDISSNYDISTILIKQPYVLNYNSIFSYGVAAIKELHTKVKAQTTNSLDQQLNSLIERIETLEA
jgi:hypothetical protein